MKTRKINVETGNLKNSIKSERNLWNKVITLFVFSMLILSASVAFAHCDTMEGPLVFDAKKAISQNNVNIVLKWIPAKDEAELKDVFTLAMKVRALNPDAEELADKSFFETLVRIHRTGEGVAYTGVKPVGTPIDEKIKAADKSIEVGNLSPLDGLVSKDETMELTELFNKVMSLKNYNINDVDAGREYIEAYVHFFKFAEGEGHEVNGDAHAVEGTGCGHAEADIQEIHVRNHLTHIPWILTVLFFITTTVFASLYVRKK
jgi:hypothetical protein